MDIFGCLEIRVKKKKSKCTKIFVKIVGSWEFFCNYDYVYSSMIWFVWKKDIDVLIIDNGRDFIYCKVNRGDIWFMFIVVYGVNDLL